LLQGPALVSRLLEIYPVVSALGPKSLVGPPARVTPLEADCKTRRLHPIGDGDRAITRDWWERNQRVVLAGIVGIIQQRGITAD